MNQDGVGVFRRHGPLITPGRITLESFKSWRASLHETVQGPSFDRRNLYDLIVKPRVADDHCDLLACEAGLCDRLLQNRSKGAKVVDQVGAIPGTADRTVGNNNSFQLAIQATER